MTVKHEEFDKRLAGLREKLQLEQEKKNELEIALHKNAGSAQPFSQFSNCSFYGSTFSQDIR